MDGDETRRRRATVWKAYGTGPAVLAGDALFALAVQTLAESHGPHCPHSGTAIRHLSQALGDLVRGQAEDLLFESRPWTGPDAVRTAEYRAMAEAKTGALMGCAAALGAALAGAPEPVVTALDRAGRHLGVAFQAVDDLLGMWGDPEVTGKPVHGDLRRRKKTLPVLAALAADGPAARELAALLTDAPDAPDAPGIPDTPDAPLPDAAVRRAAELIEQAGGRAATLAEAHHHLDATRARLASVPLAPAAAGELLGLMPFLVDRGL